MPLFSMFECQVPNHGLEIVFSQMGFMPIPYSKSPLKFLITKETSSFAPNI